MLALIMAGGEGSRLNMGEKPLVTICGRPMIEHVIEAFAETGSEVIVVTSGRTPMTQNWCRSHGVTLYSASGRGYVEDIIEAVTELDEKGPLFTSVSDIPCLNSDTIRLIQKAYLDSGKEACSTWVPLKVCRQYGCIPRYTEIISLEEACPAGINILNGRRITEEQDEFRLILRDPRLVFNINTKEEFFLVQRHLCPEKQD